jgi:hypothetical protein
VREDDRLAELECLAPLIRRKSLKELPDARFPSASTFSLPSERVIPRAPIKKAIARPGLAAAKKAAPVKKAAPAKKASPSKTAAPAKKRAPTPLNIADLL